MSYPSTINDKDWKVLEVIARGHPDRKMTATHGGTSSRISALTWSEIQNALNAPFSDISDSIAHLVANNYIGSGRQNPSLWGRLKGESETSYFWITREGQTFLREGASRADEDGLRTSTADLEAVEARLRQLGYDLTPYGSGVALLGVESGYSHAETASHLALATLARDAKEAGHDIIKLVALVPHARAMMDILREFKNTGLMREELFQNDAGAILKIVIIDKDQTTWIEKVLSDPVVGKDRVATSRIDYSEMTG